MRPEMAEQVMTYGTQQRVSQTVGRTSRSPSRVTSADKDKAWEQSPSETVHAPTILSTDMRLVIQSIPNAVKNKVKIF